MSYDKSDANEPYPMGKLLAKLSEQQAQARGDYFLYPSETKKGHR